MAPRGGRVLVLKSCVLVLLLLLFLHDSTLAVLSCLTLASVFAIKHRTNLYIIVVTFPRDFRMVYRFVQILIKTRRFSKDNVSVASLFNARVRRQPNKPCFYFEDKVWTYKDVYELSNRVAHVFQGGGYKRGDVVALCLENKPEYVALWLGLSQLGVVVALINTNLRLQLLLHSIDVAKCKAIIFSSQLASAIDDVTGSLSSSVELYLLDDQEHKNLDGRVKSLSRLLDEASSSEPVVKDPPSFKDHLLYIYTSGTTGMPKAAIIPQSRYLMASMAATCMLALRKDDIMYNPLPMYHMAGGILGTGPALVAGIPIVLCSKFSASAYWTDCIKYKCTVAQYIGEMCRYILAVPPKAADYTHNVRVMVGNGMRPAIWSQFVERFKIQEVRELYGATEGNVNIVNIDNKLGAVGSLPSFVRWGRSRAGLIKVNQETGEPIRDEEGLCIKCAPDEPGLLVGIISNINLTSEYHGYVDKVATGKKIMFNVLRHGDQAFVSGDILTMDKLGYLYFKDRTGDTFRWKGQNVATAEVEAVISNALGLRDATVYGVEIPGQEGRAGMAAIVDADSQLNMIKLTGSIDAVLPSYARPIFLRIVKALDLTGTYKVRKVDLQTQGYDPTVIDDDLYFRQGKSYVPLTRDMYEDIVKGRQRI